MSPSSVLTAAGTASQREETRSVKKQIKCHSDRAKYERRGISKKKEISGTFQKIKIFVRLSRARGRRA